MAIDLSDFFTKAGKAFHAGNTLNTATLTTVPAEVEDFTQEFGSSTPIAVLRAIEAVRSGLDAWQSSSPGLVSAAVREPIRALLVELVKADNPQPSVSVEDAVAELIKQMIAGSDLLDASTPGATPSYGSGNVGNGQVVVSVKRGDGRANEFCLAEDIEGIVSSVLAGGEATISLRGEEAATSPLAYNWPRGSGLNSSIPSLVAGSTGNLVADGNMETADDTATAIPRGSIVGVGTIGTTIKLTNVEVQTIAMSGTPTAGFYVIEYTNPASDKQTTVPLAYNASGSAVQAALRLLIGLEQVTVVTTGTTPNFTHTVTLTGVTNPTQFTSVDTTSGGTHTITHGTTTAGSAFAVRGARALEFDSDGAQLTNIYFPVSLNRTSQYAVNLFAAVDVVPGAGVLTVDLVDGIGGSVIADDQSVSNSFTIDATALTTTPAMANGVFRTPTAITDTTYLRIRISTAISSGTSAFIDEITMVEMTELYAGGPSVAAFTGRTNWVPGDTAKVAISNDRAGALHEWMNRCFDLRDNRLLLPTDNAGSETIADSLIA